MVTYNFEQTRVQNEFKITFYSIKIFHSFIPYLVLHPQMRLTYPPHHFPVKKNTFLLKFGIITSSVYHLNVYFKIQCQNKPPFALYRI